jgi:hypothetical protein
MGIQSPVGYPTFGTDMYITYMASKNLFTPHLNTCDPKTEGFMKLIPGAGLGFCIEKHNRPKTNWFEARNVCMQEGKRLPEPAEMYYACIHAEEIGVDKLMGWNLWASNFLSMNEPREYIQGSNHGLYTVSSDISSCACFEHVPVDSSDIGYVAGTPVDIRQIRFRCVK